MYHCHLRFYLVGQPCRAFEIIRDIQPLDQFSHEFLTSAAPDYRADLPKMLTAVGSYF